MNGRRTRTLAIALFVSLLANVFLVSVLVANLVLPPEPEKKSSRYSFIDDWHAMAETLPEPERTAALAKWQRQKEIWEMSREQRSAARQAANAALAAETFDAEAMRRAFTQMRSASNERWTAFQDAVLVTAPHLSLPQRQAIVEESEKRWAQREAERGSK